jgi:hypothetical protein
VQATDSFCIVSYNSDTAFRPQPYTRELKMKLRSAFLFIFTLKAFCVSAQDTTFKELGLNATPFVNQYLDFGSGNGEFSSPYMITYEQRFGKLGSRIGFGVFANQTAEKPVNGKETDPEFRISTLQLDARWGAVMYKKLSRRWDLKYGLDATVSIDNSKNWTEVLNLFGDVVTNTNSVDEWSAGFSPFVFAQFHISDHFSLGTELVGIAAYGETITKVQSSEFPQFDTRQENTFNRFSIQPPTALFFIFRF